MSDSSVPTTAIHTPAVPTTARTRSRCHLVLALLLAALGSSGCGRKEQSKVELQIGREDFEFVPRTAFAEYWELPGLGDQLRITLASYETSCENLRSPEQGEALVVLTLRSPVGKPLALGDYPMATLAATPATIEQPDVLAFVRLAREGRLLDPGGGLQLQRLERQVHGLVEASFAFSHAPDAGGPDAVPPEGSSSDSASADAAPPQPTGTLRGLAHVRLCRVSLDGARKASDPGVQRK
ncbi:MAG TPA: hypothetical protein VLC09_20035 [Polyangiaceae bacterium]|nr:hypothetical protein [Polyangiaceae bacterium]